MRSNFATFRLLLSPLNLGHDEFILALVNSTGWLRFIGDRNVRTKADAKDYINKINQNSAIKYWVVALRNEQTPIGIITYIKRDYLEFPDIGFAFLPAYTKSGYAFEATSTVINYLTSKHLLVRLLAATVADNLESIRLLEKLGFAFDNEIEVTKQKLQVYSLNQAMYRHQ